MMWSLAQQRNYVTFLMIVFVLMLSACAGIQPKGVDQYIAVVTAEVKTAYQAVGIAHQANQISQEDANKLLDRLDVAAEAVEQANTAYNAGEDAKGAGQLAQVQAILEVVRAAIPPPEGS